MLNKLYISEDSTTGGYCMNEMQPLRWWASVTESTAYRAGISGPQKP